MLLQLQPSLEMDRFGRLLHSSHKVNRHGCNKHTMLLKVGLMCMPAGARYASGVFEVFLYAGAYINIKVLHACNVFIHKSG